MEKQEQQKDETKITYTQYKKGLEHDLGILRLEVELLDLTIKKGQMQAYLNKSNVKMQDESNEPEQLNEDTGVKEMRLVE